MEFFFIKFIFMQLCVDILLVTLLDNSIQVALQWLQFIKHLKSMDKVCGYFNAYVFK